MNIYAVYANQAIQFIGNAREISELYGVKVTTLRSAVRRGRTKNDWIAYTDLNTKKGKITVALWEGAAYERKNIEG